MKKRGGERRKKSGGEKRHKGGDVAAEEGVFVRTIQSHGVLKDREGELVCGSE